VAVFSIFRVFSIGFRKCFLVGILFSGGAFFVGVGNGGWKLMFSIQNHDVVGDDSFYGGCKIFQKELFCFQGKMQGFTENVLGGWK